MASITERKEFISLLEDPADEVLAPGARVNVFASSAKGAQGLYTAMATLLPNAALPTHTHPCGEAMVVVEGSIVVVVEGRRYRLTHLDALFVPARVAHSVTNCSTVEPARVHVSFPDGAPGRALVDDVFPPKDYSKPPSSAPESLRRYSAAKEYELAANTEFRDLFASRFGSSGICGGYGRFQPGASLPCHTHHYDESITIVEGAAVCQVAGRKYDLSGCGTACIPEGVPHRFLNKSDTPMSMIWVYAGDEPDRDIVDNQLCQIGS